MEGIFIIGGFALILFILIFIIRIPIIIARKRGLKERDIDIISFLSWISLLVGITWLIALILSVIYQPEESSPSKISLPTNLDNIATLFALKEKEILTREEFDRAKSKIL